METDDRNNPKRKSPLGSHLADAAGKKPHRPPATRTTDAVHLSPRAQVYEDACKILSTLPDVDTNKVREIKARLQSGRYRVDPAKIAAKMIQDALANEE